MSGTGINGLNGDELVALRGLLAKLGPLDKVGLDVDGGGRGAPGRSFPELDEIDHDDCDPAGSSSAVSSWSEMVEEEIDAARVKRDEQPRVVGVPEVSQSVRASVTFGGFGGKLDQPASSADGGMMKQYVRTASAGSVRRLMSSIGIKLPKASAFMLAMCTHTAATMPVFFHGGKDKLKSLAVVGDAALVTLVASEAILKGGTCESMQVVRTTRLTDGHMARAFAQSQFSKYVSIASGVSFVHSKTGATALEALVGLVAFYRPPSDVRVLAEHFGLV